MGLFVAYILRIHSRFHLTIGNPVRRVILNQLEKQARIAVMAIVKREELRMYLMAVGTGLTYQMQVTMWKEFH